MHTVLHVLL